MIKNKGLDVFTLKNYCVTVMDSWTPLRLFWTEVGALRWRDKIGDYAHAFHWGGTKWDEIKRMHRTGMERTES